MTTLSIRIDLPDGSRFGPGKAELLRTIRSEGSISGAARAMGLSYPKASRLVADMNDAFADALVRTEAGGAKRGGAQLTETGARVLQLYEDMAQQALQATASGREALAAALKER